MLLDCFPWRAPRNPWRGQNPGSRNLPLGFCLLVSGSLQIPTLRSKSILRWHPYIEKRFIKGRSIPHLPLLISSASASFSAGVWHHLLDRREANPPKVLVEAAPATDLVENGWAPRPGVALADHLHLPSASMSPFTLLMPFCRSHLHSVSEQALNV